MSMASHNLRTNQEQCDMDGCYVKVSRQAVEEVLEQYDGMRKALDAACGYLLNAKIDLETGAPKRTAINTIAGGLKVMRDAIAKTDQ